MPLDQSFISPSHERYSMSNHVNNVLEVAGPESDVRRLIVSIAKEGGSPRPWDFNSFVPATTQESKKRWLTDDATIEDPD